MHCSFLETVASLLRTRGAFPNYVCLHILHHVQVFTSRTLAADRGTIVLPSYHSIIHHTQEPAGQAPTL